MKQLRHLELIPEPSRLKSSATLALLLAACLLTASFQTRSEASETDPPATAAEDGGDVKVSENGRLRAPLELYNEQPTDSDSPDLRPPSTEDSSSPDANRDPVITKVYRLKHGLAVDFSNTLVDMFNETQEFTTSLDRRTNSLLIRATPQRHEEIERLLKILDVPIDDDAAADDLDTSRGKIPRDRSDTETALEKQVQELSAKLKQLAQATDGQTSQDLASGDDQANQLATQLKDAVEKSFNERQRRQLAEIERLTTRLNRLAKSVQQREAEREQIISRKIDELLGVSSTQKSTNVLTPEEFQGMAALSMKFLYFHAPYNEPCRKMRPEMEALAAEGLPVEFINITVDKELARKFEITSVPTVVMMVHGKTAIKSMGFLNRKELRRRIKSLLEARREEMKHSSSEWQPPENPNPGEILKEAKADTAAQHYPVALSKYVWYFENALKYDPAQMGVRLSFALNDWMDLAAHYPPALDALRSLRDEAEQRFDDGSKTAQAVMEIAAINRVLNDHERTRTVFEAVAESDPTTAKLVFAFVRPSLVKLKAYTLCGKFLNPQQDLERLRQMRLLQSQVHGDKVKDPLFDMRILGTRTFAQEAATLVALLVLNDRKPEAESIAAEAKSEIADASFHSCIDAALTGTLPDGI